MRGNISKTKGFKGDKGEAFKYEDFTPEQLEELHKGVNEKVAKKADRENTVGGFTAGKDITVTDKYGEEILEQLGNAFVNSDDENGKAVWREDSGVYIGKNIKSQKNNVVIGKNINAQSNDDGVFIGNDVVSEGSASVAIGSNSHSYGGVAVGGGAYSGGGFSGGNSARNNGSGASVGYYAISGDGAAVGAYANADDGGAVGNNATSKDGAAVGHYAETGDGVALGKKAKTKKDDNVIDAIQLGSGTNSEEKTLQVYDYKLMNADGTIPAERIPKLAEHDTEIENLKQAGGGSVDLSGYYTKQDIDYFNQQINNDINDKADMGFVLGNLAGKADAGDVELEFSNINDKIGDIETALDEIIALQVDKGGDSV